jgi:hypothetical protein
MKKSLTILLLLLVAACAPTRFVEPVPEGHLYLTAALGGPLFDFAGTTIPMPLTSIAAGYGYSDKLTLFGGLHTTALMFDDLQLDLGALQEIVKQNQLVPAISVSPTANLLLAMRDGSFRLWPEADINFYWHYGLSGNLLYLTSSNWFDLTSARADNEPQTRHWISSIALGHRFEGEHWQYTTELKYLAAGVANLPNAVGYHGISGNGAFGIYLGITRKF